MQRMCLWIACLSGCGTATGCGSATGTVPPENSAPAGSETDAGQDPNAPTVTPPDTDVETDATPTTTPTWSMPTTAACTASYGAPTVVAKVVDVALDEISGLVASPISDGIFWVHNDSGSAARLYAIDATGKTVGKIELTGVPWVDPEDLASAPCPDFSGACLWVADSGTNSGARNNLAIYVVPEPALAVLTGTTLTAERIWEFGYAFPQSEKINSEALIVLPDLSAAYLFEKAHADTSRIFAYRSPFDETQQQTLELATSIAAPGAAFGDGGRLITAADLHVSGTRLAVRVYTGVYEYALSGFGQFESLAGVTPVLVALGPLDEPQGEAIAYQGTVLWTVSEGVQPKLHRYDCAQ